MSDSFAEFVSADTCKSMPPTSARRTSSSRSAYEYQDPAGLKNGLAAGRGTGVVVGDAAARRQLDRHQHRRGDRSR